jgi:prepilin-type N-terminal cleavage/methylation domain-containing protein
VTSGKQEGFTLLELMVVLTILGVLAAVIVPQFGGTFQGTLLHAAGRELMAAMNMAYSQAVTSQRPCYLKLEPQTGSYWLEAPGGPEGRGERSPSPGFLGPGSSGEIDRRIAIAVHREEDRPEGERSQGREQAWRKEPPSSSPPRTGQGPVEALLFRPDGTAQACDVVLKDRDGFALLLKVNPTTSRVRAKKLGRE